MKFTGTDCTLAIDLELVVRAITAAFEDVEQRRIEEDMETNNWMLLGRSDYIFSNIRRMALVEGVELLPFKRYVWEGRILLDRRHKATIVIMREASLKAMIRKERSRPHYAETLQHVMNAGLPAKYEQLTMFDTSRFDEQTIKDDFDSIVNQIFDPAEGFKNYFITYTTEHSRVTDIKLQLFNDRFDVVDEWSLNEFIKPDFASLTQPTEVHAAKETEDHSDAVHKLPKLKPGIKPALHEAEKQA